MADITELFAFLMPDKAAEEAIAANDPWTPLQAAPDLVSQMLMKESQDPSRSTTELMLGGLLSGLGSGYLGRLSSNYQTEKLADYTDLLPQLAAGTVTGRPEGMSQDVFNIATKKANQYDIFKKLQEDESARTLESLAAADVAKSQNDLVSDLRKQALLGKTAIERKRALDALAQMSGREISSSEDTSIAATAGLSEKDNAEYEQIYDQFGEAAATKFINDKISRGSEDWYQKLSADTRAKLDQNKATSEGLAYVADEFGKLKSNWAKFQINKRISGKPENNAMSLLMGMLGNIVKLSGDVGNFSEQEQARQLQATAGNWTSNSDEVADRIRAAVKLHTTLREKQLRAAKAAAEQGGGDALLDELQRALRGEVRLNGVSTARSDQIPARASNVVPRNPGESISDYIKRTAK